LETDLLEAGVIVDLPDKPRFGDDEDRRKGVRCATPFEDGTEVDVRYRGADSIRRIKIGTNKWFCTRIANKPDPCKEVNERVCGSEAPKSKHKYFREKREGVRRGRAMPPAYAGVFIRASPIDGGRPVQCLPSRLRLW
jgi:hypothetical protein